MTQGKRNQKQKKTEKKTEQNRTSVSEDKSKE